MDRFYVMALAPFGLFAMLLVAWPIKRWVQTRMKDGRLRRLLLTRWD